MYENIKGTNPDDAYIAVLVHEATHLARQEDFGPAAWKWKYLTSKSFRFGEELTGIQAEMKYRKAHNLEYDFERKARQFSSSTYLWVSPYERTLEILQEIWGTTAEVQSE